MEKKYKRLLLKLSGEYLGGEKGEGFDYYVINSLIKQICNIHEQGYEVTIVLGGGNFFRGASNIPIKIDRVAADHIGMMATMMNGVFLKEALVSAGKKATVMSGLEAPGVAVSFKKEQAVSLISDDHILVFAGGTGNPFFSTDTAAVLRALEIEADVVIKGTKVDGVYDKDPVKESSAVKLNELTYDMILANDLKVMDASAIALCRDNSLPLCVLSIVNPNDLLDFLSGKQVGTLVSC